MVQEMQKASAFDEVKDGFFENMPVLGATLDDLDLKLIRGYMKKTGHQKAPWEYLISRGFVKVKNGERQICTGAVLLFGRNPQKYFPKARVHFIQYDGTQEQFDTQMQVIQDVVFEGNILKIVTGAMRYLNVQLKEIIPEECPQYVRQEMIVNAIAHRDYSVQEEILIKLFEDCMIVETPGGLPVPVTLDCMQSTHFSRNSKIADYLRRYGVMKEYGSGVTGMREEMEKVGGLAPEYRISGTMLQAKIRKNTVSV